MIKVSILAAAGLLAFTAAGQAAPELVRVRGTVESSTDSSITVKTKDGGTQQIALKPETAFLNVVKSSLDQVGDGKFIGTATKGDNPPVALEVVIFPEAMRGTGEGHYPWDEIEDTTVSSGGSKTKSAMTNGTVKTQKSGGATTKSAMTNGSIKSSSGAGGEKTIDVTYDNGQSKTIKVPPTAPIVTFEKADTSVVMKGAPVFSITTRDGETLSARAVAIGKDGVVPPM